MKISIGESIAPILKNSVENLTAKIPDIQNIIINSLEKIIPAASKVLDYVIDNAEYYFNNKKYCQSVCGF